LERPFAAYRGDNPYVFVSYSHADAAAAYPVLTHMRNAGFNVWYDDGIEPGATWRDEVASALAESALDDGRALEVFGRFVAAQGGDARVLEDTGLLPAADVVSEVVASRGGFVTGIDALSVGLAATSLGAGRRTVEETVDPGVGIEIAARVGAAVAEGDVVARVHARRQDEADVAVRRVGAAFEYGSDEPAPVARLIEILE